MKKQQPLQRRKYPKGDKSVFLAGVLLTVLTITIFSWRMAERLRKENDESISKPIILEQSANAEKNQTTKGSK